MYYVVSEYTQKAGHLAGNKTYSCYKSKEDYESNHLPGIKEKGEQVVVAEGVTEDEAKKLIENVPFANKLRGLAGGLREQMGLAPLKPLEKE